MNIDCPHCGCEMDVNFGDNVYCDNCNITFETDFELVDCENGIYSTWLTGKEEIGKID
jgi:hypothetical protein|nr:MAG TPA: DNA-directed RNA polymerase [Caudoviricetes sp.]